MLAREKWQVKTITVLERVFEERVRQVAKYGHNEDLEDGVGPDLFWLLPLSDANNTEAQAAFRQEYEQRELIDGNPTWMHLVREEMAEAMQAGTVDELVAELLQVAALCVSWVEKKL